MSSQIKRGVSLYSFQNETFQGLMDLEDSVRTCAEMGANGIEIIGEQTFWGWPEVGAAEVDVEHWHALMQKYGTTPVSLFGQPQTQLSPPLTQPSRHRKAGQRAGLSEPTH